MTDSPSEAEVVDAEDAAEPAPSEGAAFAAKIGELVGATSWADNHGVARVVVDRDGWVAAATKVRDHGLPLFSWLSAVDWAKEVEVGEPVASPDDLEERFEVICRLSSVRTAASVHLITSVPKDDAWVPSLVGEFAGAEWHEREAAEMFGIEFPAILLPVATSTCRTPSKVTRCSSHFRC